MGIWEIVSITSTTLVGFAVGFFVGLTTPIKIRLKFDFRRYLIHRDGRHQEIRDEDGDENNSEEESIEENNSEEEKNILSESPDNAGNDELNNMFFEEESRKSESRNDIQMKGLKVGAQPVSFPVAKNGNKYLNNSQLQEIGDTHRNFKKLSKRDEIDIISTFQDIVGMNYKDAVNYAIQKGYMIYPIEVENIGMLFKVTRNIPTIYDARNIGVKIRDGEFDDMGCIPSTDATVIEIKNVGIVTD